MSPHGQTVWYVAPTLDSIVDGGYNPFYAAAPA